MPSHAAFIVTIFLSLLSTTGFIQDCQSSISIQLNNIRGGVFAGQKVTLTSRVDGKLYSQNSNESGEVTIKVPCNEVYDLSISNYTNKIEMISPEKGLVKQTLSYAPDMLQKEKFLSMNDQEKAALDDFFKSLADTVLMKTAVMPPPKVSADYYALVYIAIQDINGHALVNEKVWITGRKRGNTLRAITDKTGRLITYLPKGDIYDLNFKYNKNYHSTECTYSKGTTDIKLNFSYLGTPAIEKRIKAEAERLKAEEKRLKEEKEKFERKCAALGLSLEECHRRELEELLRENISVMDTVISEVLKRNHWEDKLIVCDVTGSMSPYIAQILLWYHLNYLKEKNLQFILFNDGDNKSDDQKKIGSTGGIYYSKSKGIDSLHFFMSKVQSLGDGGDVPENNMEALIKGIRMAAPFKELIMIADNHAPVKDIELLQSFNKPVHIIMCGADSESVHPDYIEIAWKTNGSVHTIESDIVSLSRLSEGQQVKIGKTTYRVMGGEFIEIF